jgi:hypothetical protein
MIQMKFTTKYSEDQVQEKKTTIQVFEGGCGI